MAKNNNLINSAKMYRKQMDFMVTKLYASFILALHEAEVSDDDIMYLVAKSQQIWGEAEANETDIAFRCYEKTGIDVRYRNGTT